MCMQVPLRITGLWIADHRHRTDSKSDISLHPEEAERQDGEGYKGTPVSPPVLLLATGEGPTLCQ